MYIFRTIVKFVFLLLYDAQYIYDRVVLTVIKNRKINDCFRAKNYAVKEIARKF